MKDPLLILGAERREYRNVSGKDILVYVLMIVAFTAICAGVSMVMPESDPQELRSTDRTLVKEPYEN